MTQPMYGPRFESALAFATSAHFGQRRKGNGAPYIIHPIAVASIAAQYGADEDQAIACLLHDVMEDCGVSASTIRDRYGDQVATIVVACTDTVEVPKPAWRPRKEKHIAHARDQPGHIKLVLAADKLHNALSILQDQRRGSVGATVWDRFSASREDVLWYYGAMTEAITSDWDHELAAELHHHVRLLGG